MSRIGKKVIQIPSGVEVKLDGHHLEAKGPKGVLTYEAHPRTSVELVEVEGQKGIVVKVREEMDAFGRSIWGTTRSNIQNIITGVVEGFSKVLEVNGVGYKVAVQGNKLILDVGYSHSVEFSLPEGVNANVEKNVITISGISKVQVGEVAANIRKIRKPEPYKGKGIKYADEIVRRKVGKAAAKSE